MCNKIEKLMFFVFLSCFVSVQAVTKNVFFAGGQSNATAEWGSALEAELQKEYGSDLVMVHINHGGTALDQWFTTEPAKYYFTDFFNTSGTGVLQTAIHTITNAGDQVAFKGFFWFQGESDTGTYTAMNAYSSRFLGMMDQLRRDLGMVDDVDFTLAVIDMNSDPYYDDPANTGGRTREAIEYFRNIQMTMSTGAHRACVDTRDYTRTDTWHLTTAERERLAVAMASQHTMSFNNSTAIDIFSHDADGCVYPTGYFDTIDLICGYVGSTPYNGISFFQLPSNLVDYASISLTVVTDAGAMTNANIDLWGIGYMETPLMTKNWFLMDDTDTRELLNNTVPVKIGDNIVTNGQPMSAGTVWQTDGNQMVSLKDYINSLYDQGAQPGDYAVFRTNPDATINYGSGLRWGGSHQVGPPDRRAKLSLILSDTSVTAVTQNTITFTSHTADGCIYNGTGKFTSNNLICGYAGSVPYNGIVFFELPTNRIATANINLTVALNYGPLTNANIDVWGLGYMETPLMNPAWILMDDTDTRAMINADVTFTKISDNFIALGEATPAGSVDQLDSQGSANLVDFLNSLFDKGAKPGDYVVIRLNPDAWFTAQQNVRWADEKDNGTRATMTLTLTDIPYNSKIAYSHENDGSVYGGFPPDSYPGIFPTLDLICGTAGNPNTRPWNGISFFQLPANRIATADLIYTVSSASSGWAATGAGIDVWGLGFVSGTPTMNSSWLLMDDTDTRTLLNDTVPSKIADNLLEAGASPAVDDVYQLNGSQQQNLVNFLNGLFDKGAEPGDYAVIRINPDTAIPTGGVSIYFGSSAATSPDRRNALNYTLTEDFWNSGLFLHYSQENDGGVYGSGSSTSWDLDSSTGGSPTFDISGIAFFALPEQPMSSASISLVAESISGPLVDANIDMWGLGYMPSPALNKDWLCISDTDSRKFLNESLPVKLADNIVTSGQSIATGSITTSTDEQSLTLTRYLNGLYDKGAKPGDFAVIRLNMDASQAGLNAGVRWGGSHRTSPDHRASMSGEIISVTNYLANSSFESGNGTAADGWSLVANGHNGERINSSGRSGSFAYKMSSNGTNGTYNAMYIYQNVYSPDFAGKLVTISGHACHESGEPMTGSQKVYFRLYWMGGSQNNTFVDSSSYNNLYPTDVQDQYKPIYVSKIAPDDVTGIKVVIIFDARTDVESGASVVDDIRLTVFQPIPPDGTLILLK